MRQYILITLFAFFLQPIMAQQKYGGGNLNPGLHTHEGSLEKFLNLKVGLSIHWGPSSLGGKEISWSRGEQIPKEEYDSYYRSFNPTKFDANAWVRFAKEVGMKYIIITSKHHDGFALWHSSVTEYDIANTPFKRDIVRELADACQEAGLVFGSYYSIIDWYHPDYLPYDHGGPGELLELAEGDTANFERYLAFMKTQLKELVQGYGAEIIQFDGEWDPTWNHILGSDLYLYTRWLDEKVLVNSRADRAREDLDENGLWKREIYPGDFEERERMVDWIENASEINEQHFKKGNAPWQAWVTIDRAQWSYNETPRLMEADSVLFDLIKTIGDNGNYLINLGPRPDGTFHPEQMEILREVGEWLERHQEAIYGSRGGPYKKEGHYTSTQKGGVTYLFVFDGQTVSLADKSLSNATITGLDGSRVQSSFKDGILSFTPPPGERKRVTVLKIEKP